QILAAGAVFVVAAGNNNYEASLDTPGNCSGVITVAATNKAGARASYSNFGTIVELAAPGGDTGAGNGVYSTSDSGAANPSGDAYKYLYGTSMAAPHVAGVASLMLSAAPSLTPAVVLSKLQSSARAFPTGTGRDCTSATCGSGMLDAAAAVRSAAALPAAPSGFSAFTLGTSSALWTWSLAADATYYAVYHATNTSSLLGSSTGPFFLRTGLSPNTTYGLFVRGINIAGDPGTGTASPSTSTFSLPISGAPLAVDISSITVSFTPLPASPSSSSAAGYLLELSTSPAFLGAIFSSRTASVAVSSQGSMGLAEYTTYYLRLASLNSLGGANFSSLGSTLTRTALVAPGTGAVSGVSETSLEAAWTAGNNPGGLQYTLFASTASDFSGTLESSATYGFSALLGSLSPDATYHLRVRASGGPFTYLGSTVTLAYAPEAAAFQNVYASSLSVAWSSGSNAQGTRYRAELSSAPAFSSSLLSSSTYGTSASFSGLWPNTSYYLRVWSLNRSGSPNGPVAASSSTLAQAPSASVQFTVHVTSISASFAAFPASPSSASCFGYLLEASTDPAFQGAVVSSRTANIALSTLTASGLDAYATYYLRLASLNDRGGPDFTSLGSTLTLTMLVAPGTAALSGVSATGAQANWTAGGNPAGLQYIAQASTAPDFSGALYSSSTYAALAVFDSLWADTSWYFRVRAATGPFAVLGSTVTLAYTPEAGSPTFSSVFLSSLSVSWSSGGNSSGTL
ncbi:MAG: S8 family serine peptidase, partial [Elusimicrobiota bacterium]